LSSGSPIPEGVGPKQIRKLVHNLYVRAGLLQQKKPQPGSRPRPSYELKFHSLLKTFKTQMEAAGVKTDYVEFIMGHKRDTYHDIESLGIEKPRNIYASGNLSVRPRTSMGKLDLIREFAKAGLHDSNQGRTAQTSNGRDSPKPLIAPLAWRDRWVSPLRHGFCTASHFCS